MKEQLTEVCAGIVDVLHKCCAGEYLTKNRERPGAGDILNGFLGSVILSFAFSVYGQRKVDASISSSILVSALISYSRIEQWCR